MVYNNLIDQYLVVLVILAVLVVYYIVMADVIEENVHKKRVENTKK